MLYLLDEDNGLGFDLGFDDHDHKVEVVVQGKEDPQKHLPAFRKYVQAHNKQVAAAQRKDRTLRAMTEYVGAERFAVWLCKNKGYNRMKFETVKIP